MISALNVGLEVICRYAFLPYLDRLFRYQTSRMHLSPGMQLVPKCDGLSGLAATWKCLPETHLRARHRYQDQERTSASWRMMVCLLASWESPNPLYQLLIHKHGLGDELTCNEALCLATSLVALPSGSALPLVLHETYSKGQYLFMASAASQVKGL